jgi:hypothetical protein
MNPNENAKVINGKKIKILVSLNEFLWSLGQSVVFH